MPGFDRDQVAIDNTVENRRMGSLMLTVGWILLWMDAMLGIYFFASLRDGSWFWPIWLGLQGVAGLGLVILGTYYRHAVGVTRLSQHDLQRTAAQLERGEGRESGGFGD